MTAVLTSSDRIKSARATARWTQAQLAAAMTAEAAKHCTHDVDKDDNGRCPVCPRYAQPNVAAWESGKQRPNDATTTLALSVLRHASVKVADLLDSYDGVLGIQGRSAGKIGVVVDPMAAPKPKDWIVTDFLARRNVTICAGEEGGGKSMLTHTIAAACITGKTETFGFYMPANGRHNATEADRKPLRVLILDVENVLMVDDDIDPSIVTERLQSYGLNEDNKHLVTICGLQGFDMDADADVLDGILGDAEKNHHPYDVVILDSFRSLWTSGSENTPAAGRVLIKYMRMAHKHDVAVLLLHHTNKGAKYSGHTSIGSTVSALWTFSKMMVPSGAKGIPATPHPTMRFLAPIKVRIAPMAKSRIVSTSGEGIIAPKTADEYAGLQVDEGDDETTTEKGDE